MVIVLGGLEPALSSPPEVVVPRIKADIQLDGKADESVWKRAATLDGFTVFAPKTGIAPRFAATGKVFTDGRALYLWVRSSVGRQKLRAPMAPRDSLSEQGDHVAFVLDTAHSARRGYLFVVSASGVLFDATITATGQIDKSWDSVFDARTHVTKGSWTAEVRIPFHSLRFDSKRSDWGLHVTSQSWHHQQSLSWAPIDRDENNQLVQAGTLNGLTDLETGRSFEFLPSVTTSWSQDGVTGVPGCDFSAEYGQFGICGANLAYGLGVKWAITPSMTVDLVLNPDYSHIEADAPQLEINNRFALELAERRPFFLEGQDLFQTPLKIVYTRSIGQPEAALKFMGTMGPVRMGALIGWDGEPPDSVTDTGFSPTENSKHKNVSAMTAIVRGQIDIGKRATVGMTVIDKEYVAGSDRVGHNQVVGVDVRANPVGPLIAEAAAFYSNARSLSGESLQGLAAHLRLVVKEDEYRVQTHYRRVSDGFRSEAGYMPRRGFHNVFTKIDFYYRSENDWARVVSPGVWANGWLDDSGTTTERIIGANTFWMFGHHLYAFPIFERVAERIDGRWLDGNRFTLNVGSNTIREMDITAGVTLGDAIIRDDILLNGRSPYLGALVAPSAQVVVRPVPAMELKVAYAHRLFYESLDQDYFADAPILRGAFTYYFTRDLSLRYILEWDGAGDEMVNDALLRYEPSPGTVFYLRYREETLLAPSLKLDVRSVFLKFSILFSA
jgi:hypothetical protein